MINKYYLIFMFSVFAASLAQILLKMSANKVHSNKIREYFNIYVIIGYGIFFCSTMLTIIAYREVSLKSGPILNATGYIFVLILSRVLLKEKITKHKMLGTLLILVGIIVFNL